jgi:hypothetical protein
MCTFKNKTRKQHLTTKQAHSIRTEKREDFKERKKVASGLIIVTIATTPAYYYYYYY